MRRLPLAAVLAVLALSAATPGFAKPPDPEVRWAKTWEDALKEAKERNVPIHVTFHKDNCPRCTSMDSSVYNQKDFIQASRRWVNVYCNRDTSHGTVKVNGEERCKLLPSMKCEDHVACDRGVGGKFFQGSFGTPATVWCDVEGKEIDKNQGGMTAKGLTEKMTEAEKKVGPGLGSDEYIFSIDRLAAAEKAVGDQKWRDAVEAYAAVLKMSKVPGMKPMLEKAQAGMDGAVTAGKARIEKAQELSAAKDFSGAKEQLRAVKDDFKGQPLAKDAEKALADVLAAEKDAKSAK